MQFCDGLIVGGGPAGSSCAWSLRRAGLDVIVLDRAVFPRDKVCAGWITPPIVDELALDPDDYRRGRVFQPFTGFRTSRMGGPEIETRYAAPVSYGIRRSEFDHYLLRRSGARVIEGAPIRSLRRQDGSWIANDQVAAPIVIGAGGHFCPVARHLAARAPEEPVIVAQELEFELSARGRADCALDPETPELYLCPDLKGYGWCVRKGHFLNVGLGRLDPRDLPAHVRRFVAFLLARRRVPADLPSRCVGHAYLLYAGRARRVVDDGLLLAGDAAGLAYAQSGEGIRPAIESGLMAAATIIAAGGRYSRDRLDPYARQLRARFESSALPRAVLQALPQRLTLAVASRLLASRWFTRHVLLDRWFLHEGQPPLAPPAPPANPAVPLEASA